MVYYLVRIIRNPNMYLFYNKTRHTVLYFNIKSSCIYVRKLVTSGVLKTKKFEDIPGPKSLPAIGTLHQYFPVLGKQNCRISY